MCEWFDETCGELLGHLESRSLSENTLVIYICDNGWDQQPDRLYNLKDDPHEKDEMSATHPEIVEKLRKKIEAWHPVAVK